MFIAEKLAWKTYSGRHCVIVSCHTGRGSQRPARMIFCVVLVYYNYYYYRYIHYIYVCNTKDTL